MYYVRNRFYSPRLGRFLQRDVNAAGLLILSTVAYAGEPLEPAADLFDPQAHYTDGLNLFAFLAADPVNSTDPLGLFLGDFGIGSAIGIDLNLDTLDNGISLLTALTGLAEIMAERAFEIEEFVELSAAGEQDAALAEFELAQLERHRSLTGGTLLVAFAARVTPRGSSGDDLPSDFRAPPKNNKVYIGYDQTGQAAYVGITRQDLNSPVQNSVSWSTHAAWGNAA